MKLNCVVCQGAEALPYDEGMADGYYDDELDDELLMENYADLVDVKDLMDAASVSDGSIMSVIDWDAVEQLIADVK